MARILSKDLATSYSERPGCEQVDLPSALSMDMVHCERQAKLALEESKGAMQLINGELIMQSYFENLAAEVQETLQVAHEPPCDSQIDAHSTS